MIWQKTARTRQANLDTSCWGVPPTTGRYRFPMMMMMMMMTPLLSQAHYFQYLLELTWYYTTTIITPSIVSIYIALLATK